MYRGIGGGNNEGNALRRGWPASEKTEAQGRGIQIKKFWERGKIAPIYDCSYW